MKTNSDYLRALEDNLSSLDEDTRYFELEALLN